MTLKQIQKLREDEPEKFNHLVAEKMRGWMLKVVVDPTNGAIFQNYVDADGKGRIWPKFFTPHNDANADLESHRVACQWGGMEADLYLAKLHTILKGWVDKPYEISDDMLMETDGLHLIASYQIGDYSAAALAVVLAHTQKTERS